MKANTVSLINSIVLMSMGLWGYFESDSRPITALIPVIVGVILLLINSGVKKENKIESKKIGFYKNDILISNESDLYHLENNKELFTKIKLEKLFIKDFFVINETLYIYDKDHLNKYLILSN